MGKNKSKLLLLIFPIVILTIGAFFLFNGQEIEKVQAGVGDNVFGWAWSENIGWISFNNTSGGGSVVSYGVNIGSDGLFSGYAWSENIDWISFADFDGDGDIDAADKNIPGSPCAPNCEARLDFENCPENKCPVYGWARALAPVGDPQAGGWDGWIKLDGPNYGVEISDVTHEFEGWAWGGDDSDSTAVIGWISFNHLNCDSNGDGVSDQGNYSQCPIGQEVADYKVETSFVFNNPPEVGSPKVKYQKYCNVFAGQGLIGFKWIYQDEDGDNQSGFDFRVNHINNVNDPNPEVDRIVENLDNPIDTTNNQQVFIKSPLEPGKITFNETYYWWARVWDNKGGNSGWVAGPSTTTDLHAWPYPDFTWSPSSPSAGEITQFCAVQEAGVCLEDESTCYNTSGAISSPSCFGKSFLWSFSPDTVEYATGTSPTSENPRIKFPTQESYTATLEITDDLGTCSTDWTVNVTFPLPEWQEVAP